MVSGDWQGYSQLQRIKEAAADRLNIPMMWLRVFKDSSSAYIVSTLIGSKQICCQ